MSDRGSGSGSGRGEEEEAVQRVAQLQLVFSKAMDVTFESLGPGDIKECFGELRSDLGNSVDGKLVQQLALSKNRLQGDFEELCDKYNLVEGISASNQQQQQMTSRTTGAVQDTLNALGRVEEEEMARLVQELEKENAQLLESRRLLSQKIDEQIAAVEEEESKMHVVVDQL